MRLTALGPATPVATRAATLTDVYGFAISTLIGVALGFMFGVGCALAVMYSIYTGGYRAALRDMRAADKPKRWNEELAKVERQKP